MKLLTILRDIACVALIVLCVVAAWCGRNHEAAGNIKMPRDTRPARSGWVPGHEFVLCDKCASMYFGSKTSRQCAPCAYKEQR